MREDPNPEKGEYKGETFERGTGDVHGFGALNLFAVTAFEKGQDVHMQVRRHAVLCCAALCRGAWGLAGEVGRGCASVCGSAGGLM